MLCGQDTLFDYFDELGVEEATVISDRETGIPTGISLLSIVFLSSSPCWNSDVAMTGLAFIRFESRDGLEKALKCDGIDFYGHQISVTVAKPRPNSGSGRYPLI